MIAWLNAAPTSTTTPPAGTNNGVHDGSVLGATRTSPGPSAVGSLESSTTRATPSETPGHPGKPWTLSPAASGSTSTSSRFGHDDGSLGESAKTNSGSRSANCEWVERRSRTRSVRPSGVGPKTSSISSLSTRPKSSISSKTWRSTNRRPNSRNGTLTSWMSLMLLVFVRSRAGSHAPLATIAAAS